MTRASRTGLRLAVDARELEGTPTGVGRYLGNVVAHWVREAPEVEILMYGRRPFPAPAGTHPVVVPAESGALWLVHELPRRLAADRPDLVFGPGYALPQSVIPGVVALHDLSFESLPGTFSTRERWLRRLLARLAASRARAIVCASEAIHAEIEERYHPACPVATIPMGIDALFGRPADGACVAALRARLEAEAPLLLFSGSIFNRRHPEALLDCLALVRRETGAGTLVLAGDDRTQPPLHLRDAAARRGLTSAVRFLSFVSDEELRALLEIADLFLWPSDYEGFGLPPLEAMRCGLPVVSSRAMEATLGPTAVVADPVDGETLARAVLGLLRDPADRERRSAGGLAHARALDWGDCARRTLALLVDAAEGR